MIFYPRLDETCAVLIFILFFVNSISDLRPVLATIVLTNLIFLKVSSSCFSSMVLMLFLGFLLVSMGSPSSVNVVTWPLEPCANV